MEETFLEKSLNQESIKLFRSLKGQLKIEGIPNCFLVGTVSEIIANNITKYLIENCKFKQINFEEADRYSNIYYYLQDLKYKENKFVFNLKEDLLKKYDKKELLKSSQFPHNVLFSIFEFGRDFIGDYNLNLALIISKERFRHIMTKNYDFCSRCSRYVLE